MSQTSTVTRVTVAEFAGRRGISHSKARYQLDQMVKRGQATRVVVWNSVANNLHNCRASFEFRQAVYTIQEELAA